jgi:hypothetical protein
MECSGLRDASRDAEDIRSVIPCTEHTPESGTQATDDRGKDKYKSRSQDEDDFSL